MDFVDVVVKCLLVDTRGNKIITDRFRKEAALWFKFRYKHVLTMYGACDVSSPPFLVCEHATNGNLFDYLSDESNRSFTFQLLREAASGLAYLHANRVVHADLKCDNILVAADRTAKIADFSFSYVRTLSASKNSVGAKAGAIRWRAPECLRGRSPTPASDVYSFGMCIIEAVGLEIPWGYHVDDDTVRDLVKSKELPDKPESMDDHAWALVERMCSFEPVNRPSLERVLEHLGELAEDEAVHRVPLSIINAQVSGINGSESARRHDIQEPVLTVKPGSNSPPANPVNLLHQRQPAQTPDEAQSLEDAIEHDNVDRVSKFPTLAENSTDSSPAANPVAQTRQYHPPQTPRDAGSLKDAIEHDDVDGVSKFLTSAATLERQDSIGATPLILAAAAGAAKVTQDLISRGANIDARTSPDVEIESLNDKGFTALHVAAHLGHSLVAEALLLARPDLAGVRTVGQKTAMYFAARAGHAVVIEMLIKHGAEITDTGGQPALHVACQFGKIECVRVLLQNKADVNATQRNGNSALQIAALEGRADVIEELVRHGATINASNDDGATALFCAVLKGELEAVRMLLRNQTDVNAKAAAAQRALDKAASGGHAEILRLLLGAGASVTRSAVTIAAKNDHSEVLALLKARAISVLP